MKVILLVGLLGAAWCQARTWTNVDGRTIEAEIIRADVSTVVVRKDGKELKLRLKTLCEEDQKFVDEWLSNGGHDDGDAAVKTDDKSEGPAAAPAGELSFDGKPLAVGGAMNTFSYPYDAETLERVTKKHKGKDTGYKIGIAVPPDFDPAKPQRVFLATTAVNNDDQARSGNLGVFGMYAKSCIAKGWVCLATDSDIGVSNSNTAMLQAFAKLKAVWPASTTWEYAVGGFSGGAKACFDPCAYLLKNDYQVVGAYLGGCNADYSAQGKERYGTPSSGYRKLKVFMSTGESDNLVSAASIKGVLASLKANGIRNTRSENFPGGHAFHQPHFDEALKWFAEAGKSS